MTFPEHLEPVRSGTAGPLKLRMVDSTIISEDVLFDLTKSEIEGQYEAKHGDMLFYITDQEVHRLMGLRMPRWEIVDATSVDKARCPEPTTGGHNG